MKMLGSWQIKEKEQRVLNKRHKAEEEAERLKKNKQKQTHASLLTKLTIFRRSLIIRIFRSDSVEAISKFCPSARQSVRSPDFPSVRLSVIPSTRSSHLRMLLYSAV